MTGVELVTAIRRRAAELHMPVGKFAAPLSQNVYTWLRQVEQAQKPSLHTIVRVQALLAGEPVPPAPANNFQKSPRRPPLIRVEHNAEAPPPIYRDPCFRCGTRGDLGCRHQRTQ